MANIRSVSLYSYQEEFFFWAAHSRRNDCRSGKNGRTWHRIPSGAVRTGRVC